MNWLTRWRRRARLEQDLDKELRFHLDELEADWIARGLSPAEARRRARLEFGGADQLKEDCRDTRGTRWLEDFTQDVRHASRRLRSDVSFTTITTLALALGIGSTTAIFSVVHPILLQPLPYPEPGRILAIYDSGRDGTPVRVTFGSYRELTARSRSLEHLAVSRPWQPAITGGGQPERLDGQGVSAAYFKVLGVKPLLGRDFTEADDLPASSNTVILSDSLWRSRFNGDPNLIGQPIQLDELQFTVIGIMPAGFENVQLPAANVWTPLRYNPALPGGGREWGHHLTLIARLRGGASLALARGELNAIAHEPSPAFSRPTWAAMESGLIVDTLQSQLTRGVKPALLAILGAVVLLLVIASVNVTGLMLAKVAQRRGEFAMRVSLGAGRFRIARQLLTETMLITLVSGALGLLVAELGVMALVALSPPQLPRLQAVRINGTVFAFGMAIAAFLGLCIGLAPAFSAARANLHRRLQGASLRLVGGQHSLRRWLVVSELALALILLVGSGLLFRSMRHLFSIGTGFNDSHLLSMQIQLTGRRYDVEATHRYFDRVLDAVRTTPGVDSAAFTSQLPLSGDLDVYGATFENDAPDSAYESFRYAVTPGYLETMGIPLLSGRMLTERDTVNSPPAVLISSALAQRKFPGENPIGKRLRLGGGSNTPWRTIVGVVGDVKQVSLAINQPSAVYCPNVQWLWADHVMSLVVRTHTPDAASLSAAVRSAVWSVDKDQPVTRVSTMEALVSDTAAERRFALLIFEGFAIIALLLAAIGIFGVISGSVTERTREIGVRVALGATRQDIVALIFRQGMALTALGLLLGILASAAASRALATLLFGVSNLDPATYIGVGVVLTLVSAIACAAPAWRASRIDPNITLRAD